MINTRLLFLILLISFPLKSLALIEVDITRGNLNPLPVAVSSLTSNENDRTDYPLSFYAATKKSNEVMAHSYSYIYKIIA